MAKFDDAADPDLGAACNRLAAFCESLPADAMIDDESRLTEGDLVVVLRRLYAVRLMPADASSEPGNPVERPQGRAGVPITARR